MKILVISNLFPPAQLGGYELGCFFVSHSLHLMGHHVHVLTSDHGAAQSDPEDGPFVYRDLELYLPFGSPAKLMRGRRRQVGKRNYQTCMRMLHEIRPDVVYVWSQLRLTLGALRAAIDCRLPIVHRFGDSYITSYQAASPQAGLRGIYRYMMDNVVYPDITLKGIRFDHVNCISQDLKDQLLESGIPIQNARIIHNGIPLQRFPLKEQPGFCHLPLRLLYVGQLHEYKGVHHVIEAAHRLCAMGQANKAEVTIAGSGEEAYVHRLNALANEGPAKVNFLGKVHYGNLSQVYQSHDIFIFPSIWREPQGITYLEAMASGLPVISTATGGQKEVLRDGENALIYDHQDLDTLVEAILRLRTSPGLRRQLTEEGRKEVETTFNTARFTKEELESLHAAIEDSPCVC